jgi:DNA-binding transcriptional ArsR family regulator
VSSNHPLPDYEVEDLRVVTSTAELKAMFHPLRGVLLELVLERAATVRELAAAVSRPPSTVAYHVGVLRDAGLFTVVRTRKVRSIDERWYGRAARIFQVGKIQPEQLGTISNALVEAASESTAAHQADDLRAILRHARIPHDQAAEFWDALLDLARHFSSLPRQGNTTYAFVAGLYPSDHPALPASSDESALAETT